jgi:hypothetical protein
VNNGRRSLITEPLISSVHAEALKTPKNASMEQFSRPNRPFGQFVMSEEARKGFTSVIGAIWRINRSPSRVPK